MEMQLFCHIAHLLEIQISASPLGPGPVQNYPTLRKTQAGHLGLTSLDPSPRGPDVNSYVATHNRGFQARRASSVRIGCTPGRVLLHSPEELCSRFPPKTPFGPGNRGYTFSKYSDRECASGGLVHGGTHAAIYYRCILGYCVLSHAGSPCIAASFIAFWTGERSTHTHSLSLSFSLSLFILICLWFALLSFFLALSLFFWSSFLEQEWST
jgi:hypothetical protein